MKAGELSADDMRSDDVMLIDCVSVVPILLASPILPALHCSRSTMLILALRRSKKFLCTLDKQPLRARPLIA